jgi:DNA-binding transcriptional ArsR family regulator
MDAVSLIGDVPRAAVVLKPLRLRILAQARQPASATTIAAALGLSRQSVNYHVRTLAKAGFLRRAGRLRKRGLVEQKYVVSARGFLLAPDVLGALAPDPRAGVDKFSVAYLLTLAARMQQEAGVAWRAAQSQGKRVPVFALDSEIRFESTGQRARFAAALTTAITRVVAEHTAPATDLTGRKPAGRRYRLALGCYPL